MEDNLGEVTALLAKVAAGDSQAEEELLRTVYDQLKSVAAHALRGEPRAGTLTPTSLVHEAFVRVLRGNGRAFQNRRHLFCAFGQAMWRIVVEAHRRKRVRAVEIEPDRLAGLTGLRTEEVLDLEEALSALKHEHPCEYAVAILRKILGLSIEDTARVLGTSVATVKRRWAFAKANLAHALTAAEGDGGRFK